jgi:hypothetical protein
MQRMRKKRPWPNLRYRLSICLDELRKTTKNRIVSLLASATLFGTAEIILALLYVRHKLIFRYGCATTQKTNIDLLVSGRIILKCIMYRV